MRRLTLQNDAVVAVNARHREALLRARDALRRIRPRSRRAGAAEILATELRRAVVALGEVSGENITEEILDRVFARFCIGK